MDETAVVTVFLRNDCEVLLLRRSEAVGSYTGRWGAVAGHAEGDPDAAARQEIREETGIEPDEQTTVVRRGEPFTVEDPDLETRWLVHPYLVDCDTRTVEPNEETTEFEWVPPTAILRRETVPELWTSYDRVRPRVVAIQADTEHGSATLSLCALELLRDEAALAVAGHEDARDWNGLEALAHALVDARPSMPVVRTRVDRTVADATQSGATPTALEAAAERGIERALAADGEAGRVAADHLDGERIATLSRSGTVRSALRAADPEAVLVAESRPGGEGVAVASALADDRSGDVTLTTDAGFAHQLQTWDADAILVGADAILPDGRVVNKVGTRSAAVLGAYEGISMLVVAASDKVVPDDAVPDLEERRAAELTDDDRVAVANPTFDVTPADRIDAIATERGILDDSGIAAVAREHRSMAEWRQ
jgi:translation initiation factor 2B subunit (eIF-2B alpha/beta/delta family)/ADP-ribose pyrophosphatase YjhB (NUDIX family)